MLNQKHVDIPVEYGLENLQKSVNPNHKHANLLLLDFDMN